MKNIALLGFIPLICVGASLHFWLEANAARMQQAQLQARIVQLEHFVAEAAAIPSTTERANTYEQNIAQGTAAPAIAAAKKQNTHTPFSLQSPQEMLDEPELHNAILIQQKDALLQLYPDVSNALHLSSEQAEDLLDLLAGHELQRQREAASLAMGKTNTKDWTQKMEEIRLQQEVEIISLVGETKAQEWKSYQQDSTARAEVREMRDTMANSTEPLSDDQVQSLVRALSQTQQVEDGYVIAGAHDANGSAAAQSIGTSDQSVAFEQYTVRMAERNQRLLQAMAPYLSSAQLANYEQLLSRQLKSARAQATIMRAQTGIEPSNNTGSPH